MKRRSVLWGSAALAAAGAGAAWIKKPRDQGAPHDPYFAQLNALLRDSGPGHPAMVLDLDRINQNIASITDTIADGKTYRIVVKSLPSLPLLEHVMRQARTRALMVFHQPFLSAVAQALPDSDVLMGKPMPVSAVRTFYRRLPGNGFDPARQLQWLIDTPERLAQYLAFARGAGIRLQVSLELDVGLHRGGFNDIEASAAAVRSILANPEHLSLAGYMGYEPHLTGVADSFEHPAMQAVMQTYEAHLAQAKGQGVDLGKLTLNGAGSHTVKLYRNDRLLNDLSAGSAIVQPSDFDTQHLADHQPALFIAAPVLKRYEQLRLPGDNGMMERLLPLWDPNTAQLYFIYGGYWKAKPVSPAGLQDWLYHSTNQQPLLASRSVDLTVDDYLFLRPTQSEHVMLQFGDLLALQDGEWVGQWPVFSQSS
jgi:D-serine deaminase-like pyridoxal phosphate-dependent protein